MLEILKFLFGWIDKSGGGLIVGFTLGCAVMIVLNPCYYKRWVKAVRKDPSGWKKCDRHKE